MPATDVPTSITEVADDVFRINMVLPDRPVTYSFFLIRDAAPALVATGFRATFERAWLAVAEVIDPATLRHIIVPHLEGDEAGALNAFLARAPHAQPVCSPIGAGGFLPDFATRAPVAVDEDTRLDLGTHRLRFLLTPYVHQWDSLLAFDETTATLFASDLFISPGDGPPTVDGDDTDAMLSIYRRSGILPSRAHLDTALNKIEPLAPQTLACHHGSVKTGHIGAYVAALRSGEVTDLA